MAGGRQGSSRNPAKCCICNGPHARCKSCACVKAGQSCSSCYPLRLNRCSNLSTPSSSTSHSQPLELESQCFSQPPPPLQNLHSRIRHHSIYHRKLYQPCLPQRLVNESVSSDIYLNHPQLSSAPLPPTNDYKEPCVVAGCMELIAPTMPLLHMSLHAKGILRGDVPSDWFGDTRVQCFCQVMEFLRNKSDFMFTLNTITST